MKKIIDGKNNFERIMHVNEKGDEYWYARELQKVLEYTEWRKFYNVIKKAIKSCENVAIPSIEHFVGADKTIIMPKCAQKKVIDYKLTRYACYLIAQNGDSRKNKQVKNYKFFTCCLFM